MNKLKLSISLFVAFLVSLAGFSQCNTTNFTVTKVNGTCFSNGSITVTVPTSTDCSAWVAEIVKTATGSTPIALTVPSTGGNVLFSSLTAGNYNVTLSNGFTTIPYPNNPVVITSSYVNMAVSSTSNPPVCSNSSAGYLPNGTLTANITGGTGPFFYKLITSVSTQTGTSALRTFTFNNVPGGEQVTLQVTDQVNGTPGCENTITQTPTTVTQNAADLAFSLRAYNFVRECSNCATAKLFINLTNLTTARLNILLQSGNAKITIAGVDYPLTYIPAQNRFTYDPVATGGPNLTNGLQITTSLNWGCKILTRTNNVDVDNNFLNVFPTVTMNPDCSFKYKITVIGDRDNGNSGQIDRNIFFCDVNTVLIERRVSTNPDVWQVLASPSVTPDPTNSTNDLNVTGALTSSLASAGAGYFVDQPGVYKVTATDACHSVTRTITIQDNIPINTLSASASPSLLSGTVALNVPTNTYTGQLPLSIKVERVDGQTSMPITATNPLSKAGNYTLNFPIIKTFNYNPGGISIIDLPPGEYKIELTDGCTASTGNKKTQIINLTNTAGYNPQFSVVEGCSNSNKINFNLNSNSNSLIPSTQLYNSSGSLVQSIGGTSGTFNNLTSGTYSVVFSGAGSIGTVFSGALNAFGPFNYNKIVTIAPFQNYSITTSSILCDLNDPNSGIVSAQAYNGTIIYPLSFSLYSTSNTTTPIQGPFTVTSPITSYVFTNVPVGNYFVRVTSACFSLDKNLTVSSVSTVPTAQVTNPTICPGSPTTVAIISATNNLYDITWTDTNGNVVGTGMPITLAPSVTTTYTATFALKPIFGCANSITYQSNVTVTVTPDPNLGLNVTDINLCDGSAPSVTISNTQSEFTYEIVNSNGTSFSPPLLVNGTGGSITIPIPNTITLVAGQTLKVKATNGNAGCTGIMTDVVQLLNGTFTITCPTFPSSSVQCYADLPTQSTYTVAQFQALGNSDGEVNVVGCGVIVITATNGPNPGCNANAIRTYTITEYADPNNNGIRDAGENTILHTTNCSQTININDTTVPNISGSINNLEVSGFQPLQSNLIHLTNTNQVVVNSLNSLDLLQVTGGKLDGNSINGAPINASIAKLNNQQWIFATYNGLNPFFTKMVLVEFSIISGQLQARQVGARFVNTNETGSSASIIAAWNSSTNNMTLANSSTSNGYGVLDIRFAAPVCDITALPTAMTTVAALETAGLTISDNCTSDANLVVTSSDGTATGTCPISFTRTYTITDACNNATIATQTININDTTVPFVTGTLTAVNAIGCSVTDAPAALTTVSALEAAGLTISDNCTTDVNLVVTSSDGSASGSCPITFTRTYTITDACNNATTATQTININDTTVPVVTGTLTAVNASGCSVTDAPAALTTVAALEAAGLTISDNCTTDANLVVTSSDGSATGTCPITFTRTYTIKDACNNATIATQTININDTLAPVVTGVLTDLAISGCSVISVPAAMTTVLQLETAGLTITDNCISDANLLVTSLDGLSIGSCPLTLIRTYTITDICGNSTTKTQNITINDTTAPVVTGTLIAASSNGCSVADAPTAMTTVSQLEAAGLTISDACTLNTNLVVTHTDSSTSGICPISFIRTYTLTDICGNSTTKTQTITINDTTDPVVTGTLITATSNGCSVADAPIAMTTVSQLEAAGLTISDTCTSDANLVVTHTNGTATGTCPITFVRTYTITDICGNSTTKAQNITINDTTAPVVTGTLVTASSNGCSVADAPSAMTTVSQLEAAGLIISDSCTSDANLVVTHTNGLATGPCPITFVRTYTITDICGNSTTKTQNITINDTTAPVVTGTLIAASSNGCSVADAPTAMTTISQLEAAGLTISDACTLNTNLVVTHTDSSTSGICPISFIRTYTITDICGNSTTKTQTITINDTTAPVVTGTLVTASSTGCSFADAPTAMTTVSQLEAAGLTISDTCTSDANLVVIHTNGIATGTCPITFVRTYTITDICGNATSATQTITINDTTAPVVTGTLVTASSTGCSVADAPTAMTTVSQLEAAGLTISDTCTLDANLVVTHTNGTATGTCPITFVRTYTITDICGNATSTTQTINISDITAPAVTGTLSPITILGCSITDAPVAMASVSQLELAGLVISDACTSDLNLVVTSSNGIPSGTCQISFVRTYTITDVCGNSTTKTQTITINDTTAPVVTGTLITATSNGCSVADEPTAMTTVSQLEAAGLTISDSCTSDANLVVTHTNGIATGTCPITFVRAYTITDACNNSITATQNITIQDTTAPVFSAPLPSDITLECSQSIPAVSSLTAVDNCNGLVTISFNEQNIPGTCPNNYSIIRTWVATDICGNSQTHTQQITIQDTTPPVFVGSLPTIEVFAKCDGIPAAPVLTATDNCGSATVTYSEVKIDGDCTNKYRLERTWTATDSCGNETQITQTVYLACYVTPFNALSPDGDGLNDVFIIEGLECYPNNTVQIVNRWGVIVFDSAYYDNVNNVFRGFSDGRSTISRNEKLPTGDYWYILKYEYDLYGRTKENIEKIGYIYIQND